MSQVQYNQLRDIKIFHIRSLLKHTIKNNTYMSYNSINKCNLICHANN